MKTKTKTTAPFVSKTKLNGTHIEFHMVMKSSGSVVTRTGKPLHNPDYSSGFQLKSISLSHKSEAENRRQSKSKIKSRKIETFAIISNQTKAILKNVSAIPNLYHTFFTDSVRNLLKIEDYNKT